MLVLCGIAADGGGGEQIACEYIYVSHAPVYPSLLFYRGYY